MTDVVDRLRKPNMNALTVEERFLLIVGIMNEAADEIERLRKIEAAADRYIHSYVEDGSFQALQDLVRQGQENG